MNECVSDKIKMDKEKADALGETYSYPLSPNVLKELNEALEKIRINLEKK